MAAGGEVADGAGNGIDAFLALAIKTMTETILVFLLGLLQVIAVGLVSWSLLQSVRNGREIVEREARIRREGQDD